VAEVFSCFDTLIYSVNRVGELPNIEQDSLVLTCDDLDTVAVQVYVWDTTFNPIRVQPDSTIGGPNWSFCETIIVLRDTNDFCSENLVNIAGLISTEDEEPVGNVTITMEDIETTTVTKEDGRYQFNDLAARYDRTLTPYLDKNHTNGVSIYDVFAIQRHLSNVQLLDSPYKLIAADADRSGAITAADADAVRKLVLRITDEFEGNTSWRFVDADYEFPDAANPWLEVFPESITYHDLQTDELNADFVGVKIGDVNQSAIPEEPRTEEVTEIRSQGPVFSLQAKDIELTSGDVYTIPVTAAELAEIVALQFTVDFDPTKLEVVGIENGIVPDDLFGWNNIKSGYLTAAWFKQADVDTDELFALTVRAKTDVKLSNALTVSSAVTTAEAYDDAGTPRAVELNFSDYDHAALHFKLYQNQPNPYRGETLIQFYLPQTAEVLITVRDAQGKVVAARQGEFNAGLNNIVMNSNDLPAAGVYFYKLETEGFTATKRMIVIE